METKTDFRGKPIVRICASCQNAGEAGNERLAFNTDQKTKDELKVVNQQVKAHSKDFSFSHGACGLHLLQSYSEIPGITPERMESIKTKIKNNTDSLPCLITDKALRHGYMKGLFTPEMIKQAAQSQQQSNHQLVERFKTLSGIKSCFD